MWTKDFETLTASAITATSGNTTVTDDDFADVKILNPSINVEKDPKTQSVALGGTAKFTITVTNDGDTGLTNVVLSDAQAGNCAMTAGVSSVDPSSTTMSWIGRCVSIRTDCTASRSNAARLNVGMTTETKFAL